MSLSTEIKAFGLTLREGKPQEPVVIILIRTILADMTTTLDRGPEPKTLYTHSLGPSAQLTTRRVLFADGSPRPSADGRSQLMRRGGTGCKLGLLGGGREDSAKPWTSSGGGGALAQGYKEPMTVSLSGYISVCLPIRHPAAHLMY